MALIAAYFAGILFMKGYWGWTIVLIFLAVARNKS
jgi:hypothetical protein